MMIYSQSLADGVYVLTRMHAFVVLSFTVILLNSARAGEFVLNSDEYLGELNKLLDINSLPAQECEVTKEHILHQDRKTQIDIIPRLKGHWVSQKCEVRPGPVFLLRSLRFTSNLTFTFLMHFYSDSSCSSPLHSISAGGSLSIEGPSWTSLGASWTSFSIQNFMINPHVEEDLHLLLEQTKFCKEFLPLQWKVRKQQQIFQYKLHDVCVSSLMTHIKEIELLMTQVRIVNERKVFELYLINREQIEDVNVLDSPSLFHPPLFNLEQRHGCHRCRMIGEGTPVSPPRLHKQVNLPPYFEGVWISSRCEYHPLGIFAYKQLTFNTEEQLWELHTQLFSDPKCNMLTIEINVKGSYTKGSYNDVSAKVDGAYNLDLLLEEYHVNPKDRNLNFSLAFQGCLNKSTSCSALGLERPTKFLNLVRLEIDEWGSSWLYLGRIEKHQRATSYQDPLIQCSTFSPLPTKSALVKNTSISLFSLSHFALIIIGYCLSAM